MEASGADHRITYDLDGADLPALTDHAFAVWHFLPMAMTRGEDIFVEGPVDAEVLVNARRMVRTWELWCPDTFKHIEIGARETIRSTPQPDKLTFFSGGMDSTYMLLEKGHQSDTQTILTVQGMDYKLDRSTQFDALLDMTQPLLDKLNYRRIILRTNAPTIARGFQAWGMSLAGHGFLLSGLFGRAEFAADFNMEQDMAISPWGLNHVTGAYFKGTGFAMRARNEDVSRTLKAARIGADPLALTTTSFCKIKDVRPRNCGTCSKCVRSKLAFAATLAKQPDIFLEGGLSRTQVDGIDLSNTIERTLFIDCYQEARARGTIDKVPGLEDRFRNEIAAPARRLNLGQLRKSAKKALRKLRS